MSAHLFVIHFPVVLVLVAAGFDLLGVALGDRALREWCWRFLIFGAIAVFLAFATGEGAKLAAMGSGEVDFRRIEGHQEWGSVGAWVVVGAALLRTLWRRRLDGPRGVANLALVIVTAGLVIVITLTGTWVRHTSG